ncbi:RNA-binding (RRM/RBD/RNP motifs) family protein [Wolffia australiana]
MAAARMALPAIFAGNSSTKSNPLGMSVRIPNYRCNSLSIYPRQISWRSLPFERLRKKFSVERTCLAVEESVETSQSDEGEGDKRRKLYVANLPWNFTAPEMRELFGQCGTVADVEIIKQKGGRGKGFAFITMSTSEEAQALIEKFDSYELQERIIRVEFAKSMKKPPRPANATVESRHKIYVSNLSWKVRSNNLKEFFAGSSSPVSARVVFDTPTGKAAGYGFVAFSTEEEMQAAISALDGKELMGRPVRLKVSERKDS